MFERERAGRLASKGRERGVGAEERREKLRRKMLWKVEILLLT